MNQVKISDIIIKDESEMIAIMDIKFVANNLYEYDFKEECTSMRMNEEKSYFKRFLLYKLYTNNKIQKINFDCDSCYLITQIYKNLFCFLNNGEIVNMEYNNTKFQYKYRIRCILEGQELFYSGDTMTSAWKPLKRYMVANENIKKKLTYWKNRNAYIVPWKKQNKNYENEGIWANYLLEIFDDIESNIGVDMSFFLKVVHTVGNFIPVPEGFNSNRVIATNDCWDKTMLYIYKWYREKNDSILCELLDNNVKAVTNCKKWLAYFSEWQCFVKENYLSDFINEDGTPKKFDSIEKMSYAILRRGQTMTRVLTTKLLV